MKYKIFAIKGYPWKNLFAVQNYERMYLLTQLVTLSRYVHVGVLAYTDRSAFFYQATSEGVKISQTDIGWIQDQVAKDRIDLFDVTDPQRLQLIDNCFTGGYAVGAKYNYKGLFHIAAQEIFGIIPPNSQITHQTFCSELVASIFDLEKPMQYSPEDIVDLPFLHPSRSI